MNTINRTRSIGLALLAATAMGLSSCAELNEVLGYDSGSRWYRDRMYVNTWAPNYSNPRTEAIRLNSVANPRVQDRRYPQQGVIYNYGVPRTYKKAGSIQSGGPGHYNAGVIKGY